MNDRKVFRQAVEHNLWREVPWIAAIIIGALIWLCSGCISPQLAKKRELRAWDKGWVAGVQFSCSPGLPAEPPVKEEEFYYKTIPMPPEDR